MENIQNPQLKAALELFISQDTKSFTFGAPEIYKKNNINLSNDDVKKLFDGLIANKEKVHNLYLYGTGITEIPESIGQLSNLILLNLSYNKIEKLPDVVCDLKTLQTLSLSNNKITNLPERIGELENLNWVDLNENPITNLPDSIINLRKLEKLNLNDTGIKKEDINKIEQLEQICKNNNDNTFGTKKDKEFYKNPKIYIDGIGLNRTQNKNVLSKYDFDNIIRGIRYPSPGVPKTKKSKATKVTKKSKTPSPPRMSPSPKSATKKSRKTPTP